MIIHRIRTINIDGNKLGKVWGEKFFMQKEEAEGYLTTEVDFRNWSGMRYIVDTVEGVIGYCDWMSGVMISYDSIKIND